MTNSANESADPETAPEIPSAPAKKPHRRGRFACLVGLMLGLIGLGATRLGWLWIDFDVFNILMLVFHNLRQRTIMYRLHNIGDVDSRLVHIEMTALDPADVRQIGHQHRHTFDGILDALEESHLPFIEVFLHQGQVSIARDTGHRHL